MFSVECIAKLNLRVKSKKINVIFKTKPPMLNISLICVRQCLCMRACVRAWVRACVRAWVRACVRACMRACVRACVRTCVRACV